MDSKRVKNQYGTDSAGRTRQIVERKDVKGVLVADKGVLIALSGPCRTVRDTQTVCRRYIARTSQYVTHLSMDMRV